MAGVFLVLVSALAFCASAQDLVWTAEAPNDLGNKNTETSSYNNPGVKESSSGHLPWPPIEIKDYVVYPIIETFECGPREYARLGAGCTQCKTYFDNCGDDRECCPELTCRTYNSNANINKCICKNNLEWDGETKKCQLADYTSQYKFMTAAQMALGIALIIAVTALAALTCKMCAHRRGIDEVVRYHRDSGSASLNSVQLFVIGRMRDRPPRYDDVPDKPPEYEDMSEVATLPMPRIPVAASRVRLPGRRSMLPPRMTSPAPPLYSVADIDETRRNAQDTAQSASTEESEAVVIQMGSSATLSAPDTQQPAPEPPEQSPEGISATAVKEGEVEESGVNNPAFIPDNACHM